ncbi:hypothetical protein AGLY_006890 [Aphis glycines]|uniref:Uncharacterized protein n=1 Tax=Aphis glycines TaxID=307491 RepID=A0A6G0TPX4_APHGL|nr:hypothetical protein AGLY_006890 [Aphis glycines]
MHDVYPERPTDGRPLFLFVNYYEYPVSSMSTVSSRNGVVILNEKYEKIVENVEEGLSNSRIMKKAVVLNLAILVKKKKCIKFSTTKLLVFLGTQNIFIDTLKKKISAWLVFELKPYKKIYFVKNWFCVKNSVFPSLFFLFFPIFLKTVRKFLLLICIMHQEYSHCHRKPPLKFEIYEDKLCCTQTQNQKTKTKITHHCKINKFMIHHFIQNLK